MKRVTLEYRVKGSDRNAVLKVASRLASHHQTEGKVVRMYRTDLGMPEQLPDDADVIIISEVDKP